MPDAVVLETLRTARTKASPRGGFADIHLDAGPERMNPNGGTIAMGHAFGATGAILLGCAVDELERRGGRYGVAAVSGAAGLGVTVLVERIAA